MRRLHPATMIVALLPKLREVISTVGPILFASAVSGKADRLELYLSLIGFLGGFGAIGTFVSTRFAIEADRVTWKSGIFWKKDRQIPLDKIQNVTVTENVLERVLRVATVEVETAAGAGPELKLRVLGKPDAESFRDELLAAAALQPTTAKALGDVHAISRRDLFLGALSENHLGVMMLGLIGWTPFAPLLAGKAPPWWLSWLIDRPIYAVLAGIGALILLALVGWIWGAALFALRYGGFRIIGDAESFRISYGWLSKVQLNVRRARIELVTVKETLVQRWLGRATLNVATAGSFGEAGTEAPVALMIPLLEAEKLVAEVIPGASIERLELQRFPPVYYRSRLFTPLLFTLIFGSIAWALGLTGFSSVITLQIIVLTLPAFAFLAVADEFISRSKSGYALTDTVLVVRSGFLTRSTRIMRWDRMEYLSMQQRPFWRRAKAWYVHAGGMARTISVPAMREEDFEQVRHRTLAPVPERRAARRRKRDLGLEVSGA